MAARKLEIRGNLGTPTRTFHPGSRGRPGSPGRSGCRSESTDGGPHRAARGAARNKQRITFLDPQATIARTKIKVQDARAGAFVGSEIPKDLQRQWIQGTGPAAKPNAPVENSIRNVAYALLSGADGWMFDGEDALGQISTMSLDNQRNLKLAIHRDPVFTEGCRTGGGRDEQVGAGLFRTPHHQRLEKAARLHDQDLSRARAASGRPSRAARRRRQLFRVHRRCGALRRQ